MAAQEGGGGDVATRTVVAELTFAFEIPRGCAPGTTMRVPAPDGNTLMVPMPEQAMVGDKIYMAKMNGAWTVSKITRTAPVAAPTSAVPRKTRDEVDNDLVGDDVVMVNLNTTKGQITLHVVPHWAPMGAERFLQMVDDNYFTDRGVAIYRGVKGFLVQFGVVKDPVVKYQAIPDDPLCGVPIEEGTLIFAAAGANTRTSTLCLFLGDCPYLGKSPWETPIGKVAPDSLPTLHELYLPGDIPECGGNGASPTKLEAEGNEYISENFPDADYVIGASRVDFT